jgi:hypothetical protein
MEHCGRRDRLKNEIKYLGFTLDSRAKWEKEKKQVA